MVSQPSAEFEEKRQVILSSERDIRNLFAKASEGNTQLRDLEFQVAQKGCDTQRLQAENEKLQIQLQSLDHQISKALDCYLNAHYGLDEIKKSVGHAGCKAEGHVRSKQEFFQAMCAAFPQRAPPPAAARRKQRDLPSLPEAEEQPEAVADRLLGLNVS